MITAVVAALALGGQKLAPIMDFPKCLEPGIEVKVLVLNFDPKTEAEGRTVRETLGYNDPRPLADQYMADVNLASGGYIKFKVVEWRDLDAFPPKKDGFIYTPTSYLSAQKGETKWHDPDGADYEKILDANGVAKLVDEKTIDEVWLFGGPFFGFWESAMAGPRSFEINGGVYEKFASKRPFAIMGFNYERGVAEMVHDLAHRTEATMARIYGGWDQNRLDTPWAKFAASEKRSGGFAGVGSCHWPPNAEKEYDYDNLRIVWSNADGWMNFPKVDKKPKPVSRENWGGPDFQRNYLKWWFARLPKAPGENDKRQNNWWKYVFSFDSYDASGRPVKR